MRTLLPTARGFSAVLATLAVVIACGRGDRPKSATADSASVQGAARNDSAAGYSVRPPATQTDTTPPVISIFFPHPATILAADSAAGQTLYRQSAGCLACHGIRGVGVSGIGSSLTDTVWARGNGSLSIIYSVIRDGMSSPQASRSGMPGLGGRLTPREIFQVAAYVYTLSHPSSTIADANSLPPSAPPVAVPPTDTLKSR